MVVHRTVRVWLRMFGRVRRQNVYSSYVYVCVSVSACVRVSMGLLVCVCACACMCAQGYNTTPLRWGFKFPRRQLMRTHRPRHTQTPTKNNSQANPSNKTPKLTEQPLMGKVKHKNSEKNKNEKIRK